MRTPTILALFVLVGCTADSDPRSVRLQTGQRAEVRSRLKDLPTVPIKPVSGEYFPKGSAAWASPGLDPGDIVKVLSDASKAADGSRLVQSEIAASKNAELVGTACLIERHDLVPAP